MAKFEFYFETMAGTHLADAVRALRDSGSADSLYDDSLRVIDPDRISHEDFSLARDEAEGVRVSHSRRALLFAAFAAEAYANEFLYARWQGKDREALQRLSTVDKYVLLPALAQRTTGLDRGRQPLQKIKWLFQRRDELVHAAPKSRDLTYDPENHNPREAAACIVAVCDAVAALGDIPGGSILGNVVAQRNALIRYGERAAGALPAIHEAPEPTDLLIESRRRNWSR